MYNKKRIFVAFSKNKKTLLLKILRNRIHRDSSVESKYFVFYIFYLKKKKKRKLQMNSLHTHNKNIV